MEKLPKYDAYLSLHDLIDIENYEQQGKRLTYPKEGGVIYEQAHSELDISVYALGLGLKELDGVKITKDNLEAELEKIGADQIIRLSAEIRLDAIKKKPKTS